MKLEKVIMEKKILALAALGLVGGVTPANAQPFVINISGATLLENLVRVQSSTNDYLDCDGDGIAASLGSATLDQLAPPTIDPFSPSQLWAVQYRAVGSINGLIELTTWGSSFATLPGQLSSSTPSNAYYNGDRYLAAGVLENPSNSGNPGSAPVTSDTTTLQALRNSNNTFSGGGIRIDIAPVDVSSRWATQRDGSASSPTTSPSQSGYGQYNRVSRRLDGSVGGLTSNLPGLNGRNLFDPANPGAADANTLFDTPLTFAPIGAIVNYGVGRSEIEMTDLQHLFVAGRLANGENLTAVTRDVGSGTRNAFNNTTRIDPSWGVGENVGGLTGAPSNSQSEDEVGGRFVPSNKQGGSNVLRTVQNSRLAIGYAGPETGVTGSYPGNWLGRDAADLLAVRHNVGSYVDNGFRRPTIQNVLDGLYNIGGPAVLITLGDPRNQAELGGQSGNTNPRMRNTQAAAYVNNITRSAEAFTTGVGNPDLDFTPGQYLATQFVLTPALTLVHNQVNPTQMDANSGFSLSLYNYTLANNQLANAEFASFNSNTAGRVPRRLNITSGTYSDGTQGGNYIAQSGASVAEDAVLALRNKVAFDFNGDGVRSPADVADAVAAWRQRQPSGPAWTAPDGIYGVGSGQTVVIEVLGDLNSDGSYTAADLRYYADGLHLVNGSLDRKAGFTAVDNAFGGNFFGTTKSTGTAHNPGDSRADIAGPSGNNTRGFSPIGSDGTIDVNDLIYIRAQFINNPFVADNEADWADLSEAAGFDLSADLTGDLKVNADDLAEFYTILGTCPVDFNFDGFVDFFDYDDFVAAFEGGNPLTDFNNDGFLDFFDYDDYVGAFEAGC
jgi:hypothetical protein